MPHLKAFLVILFLLSGIGQLTSVARGHPHGDVYGVSLPEFAMGPQEAIVGVEYDLKVAVITSIATYAAAGNIHIRNGDELMAQLDAQALFLSASIRRQDLPYLKNFISIREDEPEQAHMSLI